MSEQHTRGRMTFKEDGDANHWSMLTEDGRWWLALLSNGEQTSERQVANFRRIAACWNACEGIDTSLLEQLRFPLSVLHRRELELLAQRDELLMALQLVVANTSDGEMLNKMARAAIARVEGGAT